MLRLVLGLAFAASIVWGIVPLSCFSYFLLHIFVLCLSLEEDKLFITQLEKASF